MSSQAVICQASGFWLRECCGISERISEHYQARGAFTLPDEYVDSVYRQTGCFGEVKILLPCHANDADEFLRLFGDVASGGCYFFVSKMDSIVAADSQLSTLKPGTKRKRTDDWGELINDAIASYTGMFGDNFNATQLWLWITKNIPHGYNASVATIGDSECLTMPRAKPLKKQAFKDRIGRLRKAR